MGEAQLFETLTWVWLGVAAASCLLLLFVSAPYGRHVRAGWGPTIPSTLGWVVMEAPAVLVFLACFLLGDRKGAPVHLVFLGLWLLHYVNRSFVFPFRRRGGERPMPISIAGSAFFFNLVNGYLQGRWLNTLGPAYEPSWLLDPRFLAGAALFLLGFAVNLHADAVLRNLRKPGETGYRIPYGGLYRWVSSPNYLGEILEWTGWAVLTSSWPGLVFALWTAANLAPRALTNHRWYRERFPDYPKERKALVPFVL
jgi:protein-S-isoprenylcysteine O-methyltransferase Ste14